MPAEGEAEFGENSPMAAIQSAGVLRIAVPAERPPFASGDSPEVEGFTVDLARELADRLEVELSVATLSVDEMQEAVGGSDPTEFGDGTVDIAFTLEPLTQELYKITSQEQGFEVTTPYYVAHQRLLVRDEQTENLEDLDGATVCSILHPVAGVPVDELVDGAEVKAATTPMNCARAIVQNDAEAMTAFDDVLLTTKALLDSGGVDMEIVGDQLATAGYPLIVDQGMAGYVSGVLNEIEEAGAWTQAYEDWIQGLSGAEAVPPEITLEDAAAIYPVETS
ncbi:MAG: transporter substrate-binding domain-containing protein [Actinomycetota bacterium]|nr:transporter substrate-binding domain-containing protein [Actinomycetota bacterium]